MMEEGNGPFRPLQFVTSLPTDAVRTSPMGPSRPALTYANVTQNMHTNQGLGSFVHAPAGYYQQQQQQQQANYMNALSTNSMSREESIWFTPKKAPMNATCVICLNEVAPDQVMMVNDVLMHKNCVVCDICRTPLTSSAYLVNNQRVYCEEHYMKLRVLASKMQLQQELGPQNQVPQAIPMDRSHDQMMDLTITVQPACFQIANYNVFPAPKVTLTQAVTKTCTVNVSLVECSSNLEMMDGFQAGNSKTLRIGGTCVHFAGLKFAKMGKIKGELRDQHVKKWESFCLRFTIGERTWDSQPFKLVSSCTQLPKDLRDAVRPPKRPHSILGSPSTSPLTLSSPSPSPSPSPTLDPSLASALFPLSSNAISYIFKEPAYPKNEL